MTTKNPYNQIKEIHENGYKNKTWNDITDAHMDKIDAQIMEIVNNDFHLKQIFMLGRREQLRITKAEIKDTLNVTKNQIRGSGILGVNNEQH